MSDGKRYHMRIALSDADYAAFTAKKVEAEKTVGVIMSDPQFALSLIRWAVKHDNE
jgi:cysteine sulfinate desulfinase/cysteine desulfurase-like protein